jgi:hypothetical protein
VILAITSAAQLAIVANSGRVALLAAGRAARDRSPVYQSCDPTGAAVATIIATKTINERIVQISNARAPRSCGKSNGGSAG